MTREERRSALERLPKKTLLAMLKKQNPFGGYPSTMEKEVLIKTLLNYELGPEPKKGPRPVDVVHEALGERGARLLWAVETGTVVRGGSASTLEMWVCRGQMVVVQVFDPLGHGGVTCYGTLNQSALIKDEITSLVRYLDEQPGRSKSVGGVRPAVVP